LKILVTGAAGFIGFHTCQRFLVEGHSVVGIDNLNNYYDPNLKQARLNRLLKMLNFSFEPLDLTNYPSLINIFTRCQPDLVVHLAAQAGVRYSLDNPHAYVDSNLTAFVNILESCRHHPVQHLVYASSSSVYGGNQKIPFSVGDAVDQPVSLYAATKRANELMAYTYSHLYQVPTTGLRFFTVYGPWGRPDMAYFSFTRAIMAGQPINVFNHGQLRRDFTYIDDAVEALMRLVTLPPNGNPPHQIYNLGHNQPVPLLRFIEVLETYLGRTAKKKFLPMQPGDVLETYADIDDLVRDTGFTPSITIEIGLEKFINWYRDYHA
jgi:UDP-glucuronate 4-epimerase